MEDEFNYINCVRLFADLSVFDNPKNSLSNETICIRAGDSVRFDVILLNNSTIADCTNIVSASFEIMDIGEVNRALPRNCKTLFKKEILAEFINKNITQAEIDLGKCHFSVPITSSQAYFTAGDKYLKISAYLKNGDKVTFASGWIYVAENFEADLCDNPQQSISIASELQGQIHAQNDKLNSISAELYDLTQSSNNLQEQKADKFEVASNLELQNLNINDLQLFKANTGALHFNGGTLVVGASGTTDKMPSTFSWCRTLNITQEQWSNVANGRHFDTNSSSSAKGLSIFKTSNRLGFKYGDGTFASGNILLSEDETNVIIDGKNHTLIIVGANERLRIYVDNILLRDVSVVGATTIPSTSYRYQIDRFTGKYSRIYNFNFDITSEDAPYTIADYQQGKPIPPKAFYGQDSFVGGIEQSYSWVRSGLTMTSNITFDENGTNFIFDNTNGTLADYQIVDFFVNIPKGAYLTAEGDWSNIYSVIAFNNSTNIGQIIATGNVITPLMLSADCTSLRIRPLSTGAGSTRTITLPPSCKIKVNGTILALEDYTINGKVLDYSGNKNHATITGNVMGDNDTRIEAFVEEITTSTSEQN